MKTIHSISRYVLALILMMAAAQQLQAQDAFYIYRNDGDFNGFFFDEVIRMSYSKTDLEGEEHNEYVIQEVETKDSLYRIPLCAIDSIGFQQPEIKMNPNVRIIERCGLKPYLGFVRNGDDIVVVDFYDVPEDLKPKVGDVLISLGFDDENLPIQYSEQCFSCVVDKVQTIGNVTNVEGHSVTDPGEVFEQFISVENVTVDQQGNVRRRLAGWNPEKAITRESGGGEFNLVDFDFNITREFNPTENSKISLDANLGMKFRIRATYDIGWTKFYVKLTRDLITKVEPSLSMGIKGEFMKELDDIIELPEILFPASCPIFGLNPYPSLFIHAWGEITAKLTFPKMEFGLGDEITFNSDWLFPIDYSWHIVEPEEKDRDHRVIDVGNTSVKFSGSLQAGLKVGCSVGTANWMKKIIKGDVNLFAYIGPQIDAQMEFQTNWLDNDEVNLYDVLSKAEVNVAGLSVNVEAKATLGGFWQDQEEKTFLTKDWKFLKDTLLFVPRFQNPTFTVTQDIQDHTTVYFALHPKPLKLFYLNRLSIGIFEPPIDKEDYEPRDMILVKRLGDWSYYHQSDSYEATLTKEDVWKLEGNKRYALFPMVTWLGHGPYPAFDGWEDFVCPSTMEMENQELHFSAAGGEASLEFKTNVPKKSIFLKGVGERYSSWHSWVSEGKLEAPDEAKRQFKATFTAEPNKTLWDRRELRNQPNNACPGIAFSDEEWDLGYRLDAYQEANSLNNFEIEAIGFGSGKGDSGSDGDYRDWSIYFPRHKVNATRVDDNLIHVEGEYAGNDGYKYYISFDVQRTATVNPYDPSVTSWETKITNGTIREFSNDGYISISGTFHVNKESSAMDGSTYKEEYSDWETRTYKSNGGNFNFKYWIDGEEGKIE